MFSLCFCMQAAFFVEILMEAHRLLWRSNPWPFSYRHVSPKRRPTMLLENWIVTCTFLTKHPVRFDYLIANKCTAARPRRTARGSLVPLNHSSSGQSVFSSVHCLASTSLRNVSLTHTLTHTVVLLNFWLHRLECGRLSFHESEAFPFSAFLPFLPPSVHHFSGFSVSTALM